MKAKEYYCVVMANSTSGAWIVEKCQKNVKMWSKSTIALVTTSMDKAIKTAKKLNKRGA